MDKFNYLLHKACENLKGVIVFSLDAQYCYTGFTASHKEVMNSLWGADIEIGECILDYISREDDRIKIKSNFDRALAGEFLTLQEEYGDEKSHVRSWWECRYFPIFDFDNRIAGALVMAIDITHLKQVELALATSRINYFSIMEQASDGIFLADQTGRYLDVNRAGCEMLGYTREEILQLTMQGLAVPDPSNPIRMDELLDGKTLLVERELLHKNGIGIPVEISAKMLEDGRLLGMVRDISKRRQEEERIRYLAFVMNKISTAVISTDMDMRITQWNLGAEGLYGWNETEVLGRLIDEVCGTKFAPSQQEAAQFFLQMEKHWNGELAQRHRDGRDIWVDVSVTQLEDEQGHLIGSVTINRDITSQKLAEEELRRTKNSMEEVNLTLQRAFEREQLASRTDSLTGAFNRRFFFELLEYELAASKRYERPLAVAMFDIDLFKQINDTYGHQAGDEILKSTVQLVQEQLRESDILARYGGDEFAILLSGSDEADSKVVLERIHQKARSRNFSAAGSDIRITISSGISSLRPGIDKADQLMKAADEALYFAKRSGRDQVMIYSEV